MPGDIALHITSAITFPGLVMMHAASEGPAISRKATSGGVAVTRRDTWMVQNESWLRENHYEDEEQHQLSLAARMEAAYGDEEHLGRQN